MLTFRLGRLNTFQLQSKWVIFFLWLFLLVFPKGGFKIGGAPITWGYLILGFVTVYSVFRSTFKIRGPRVQAFVLSLPFQLTILSSTVLYGIGHVAFAFSFFMSFIFIPSAFLLLLSENIETMEMDRLSRLIKVGIFLIASYGIFLFFYKFLTHKLIEIPFLTTNYHDTDIANKCNNRGLFTKLISTYNNGNIYGVCVLMFLPFYSLIENKKWRMFFVYLSLILTLSRSVWVGMVFNEFVFRFLASKKTASTFFKLFGAMIAVFLILAVYLMTNDHHLFHNQSLQSLAGREDQFRELHEMTLFKAVSLQGVGEIVYLGIISHFGMFGLITFLTCMTGPILISLSISPICPMRKALLCGLINYLFVSLSDGAMLFIPTMVFYWFLSSLALRKDLHLNSMRE